MDVVIWLFLCNIRWAAVPAGEKKRRTRSHQQIIFRRKTNTFQIKLYFGSMSSVESQKSTITIFKDVPLRTRRALSPETLYSDSTLLVLNGTSWDIDSALLALNWRHWDMESDLLTEVCNTKMNQNSLITARSEDRIPVCTQQSGSWLLQPKYPRPIFFWKVSRTATFVITANQEAEFRLSCHGSRYFSTEFVITTTFYEMWISNSLAGRTTPRKSPPSKAGSPNQPIVTFFLLCFVRLAGEQLLSSSSFFRKSCRLWQNQECFYSCWMANACPSHQVSWNWTKCPIS